MHAAAGVGPGLDARAGGCGGSRKNAVQRLRWLPSLAALTRANRPVGNQRCVCQQGLRRPGHRAGPARMQMHRAGQARMQMRAPSTRPARDSPGVGVGLIAAVGMAVATRRNMLCFLSVLQVPAARLRLHAVSSSTRRTCATSTTTHCSRCARVRSPRCLDMLCRSVMVQHGMLQHGATAPHSKHDVAQLATA